jgi:hypothetical protein
MPGGPGATAFDALQKWQPQPGRMAFYQGDLFGVVESPDATNESLNRFILSLESQLPPGDEARR